MQASPDRLSELIFAYGGANGLRGARGGDIGCEREPVSEFFQLKPGQCRDNFITLTNNTFTLCATDKNTIGGVVTPGTRFSVADATKWDSPGLLLASSGGKPELPVVAGEVEVQPGKDTYITLALQLMPDENGTDARP